MAMASNAADSYIGSFISLISKYDIRYEGILFELNALDSTISLQNVRSFGTEGRRKDGPQIPPSDKVYEFIRFRGSDIKDLQVMTQPARPEEHVHHDPAIIQSHYTGVTPTSPFTSISGKTLAESAVVQSNPSEMTGVYSGLLPPYQYANHVAPTIASQANQNSVPSFSSSVYWHNGTPISGQGVSGQPVPFQPQFAGSSPLPAQSPLLGSPSVNDSPILGLTNASVSPASLPCVASNPLHTTFVPHSPVESHNSVMASSPSMTTAFLPANPLYSTANKLIKPSVPSSSENGGRVEAPTIGNTISVSATANPALLTSNASLALVRTTSNPLLPIPPSLSNFDQQAQSRLLPSIPVISAPASQEPLLPLPCPVQQFTEEFDFEAMNEKFKKDEVWGYLGKSKQVDGADCAVGEATDRRLEDKGSLGQSAYKKDDFFDTISCNTRTRSRSRHNFFSERMKQDIETFGSFRRSNPGFGDYSTGLGNHNYGQQNRGRGNVYGRWGRGRAQN